MLRKALTRAPGVASAPRRSLHKHGQSGLTPFALTARPWYGEGLKFKCTGCGACCKWEGDVWLTEKDIVNISKYLKLGEIEFIQKFVVFDATQEGFKVTPGPTPACRFLNEQNKCSIYPVRPDQCSTFPFWEGSMTSKQAWDATQRSCEGINHPEATLVPKTKIQAEFSRALRATEAVDSLKQQSFRRSNPILTELNELVLRSQRPQTGLNE